MLTLDTPENKLSGFNAPIQIDCLIKILNCAPVGILILRLEDFNDLGTFRFLYANASSDKLTGIDFRKQAVGTTMRESFPNILKTNLVNFYKGVLVTQKSAFLSEYHHHADIIAESHFKITASPITEDMLIVFFQNTSDDKKSMQDTHIKKMQLELEHISRISLMNELSTSISHELNQPLAAITNYAHGCISLINQDININREEILDSLAAIERQACRAGDIVRHLRKLSKKGSMTPQQVNLKDIIHDALKFLSTEMKQSAINVSDQVMEDIFVYGDKVLLQQLLLNLITNAIDSMKNQLTRELAITSSCEKGIACLFITDTGIGIPDEYLNHACDAFFTTKEKGLGIGLSICTSILEQHGGSLTLKPLKNGTAAIIQLPLQKEKT